MKSSPPSATPHTRDYAADLLFGVVVGSIGRILLARDWLFRLIPPALPARAPGFSAERCSIESAQAVLDAVLVKPAAPTRAALLLCHGIGEVVEHWGPVQVMLAASGVASLVFDYRGYGRSRGMVTARGCEDDAVSAFEFLRLRAPSVPLSLLGFSLGSGVAAAVLRAVPAERLVICAAFNSFRAAARRIGWPGFLSAAVPDIWRTEETLRECGVPVLIMHGERDQLFPPRMALELKRACGPSAVLVLAPGVTHAQPYHHPRLSYWGAVADFVAVNAAGEGR